MDEGRLLTKSKESADIEKVYIHSGVNGDIIHLSRL